MGGLKIAGGAPSGAPGGEEAVCAECGRMFPVDETIRIGEARVCANCKPIFVQKMREGVNVGVVGTLNYAGFWVRFAAVFLDGVILKVVNIVIMLVLGFGLAPALAGPPVSMPDSQLCPPLCLTTQLVIAGGGIREYSLTGKNATPR